MSNSLHLPSPPSPRGPSRGRRRRRLSLGRWVVAVAATLIAWVAASPACAKVEFPEPTEGYWAPTSLALLDYNKDLCDGIAGRVLAFWSTLGGTQEENLERVQRHLVNDALSDLAAGRAASDIVQSFLPRAKRETDSETGASLERLYDLEKTLCDTVAYPSEPLDAFSQRIQRLLDQIEREEEQLGHFLVISDQQLRELLGPYLQPIQLAGFEAQNEYLDYLESLKPKPKEVTVQEKMTQWHRAYAQTVQPTKTALGNYFKARKKNDFRGMAAACRGISAEVIPLLRRREVFSPPKQMLPKSRGIQPQFLRPLYDAYVAMRTMATHCSAGRSREVLESLQEMQEKLQEAAAYLRRYSVTP